MRIFEGGNYESTFEEAVYGFWYHGHFRFSTVIHRGVRIKARNAESRIEQAKQADA